jgi:hypothetical protein
MLVGGLAAAVAVFGLQRSTQAGVALVSQNRFVELRPAPENVGGNPGALEPGEAFRAQSNEAGVFDESLVQVFNATGGSGTAEASASQESNITADRLAVRSIVGTDSDGPLVEARSLFSVVFDVDQPQNFEALISWATSGESQGRAGFDVFELTLREQAAGGQDLLIEDREFGQLVPNPFERTETGVLQPGRYQFTVDALANVVPDEPTEANFVAVLAFSDADGGGGGQPNPIPLPPAAWAAAVTLAGGAAARGLCRFRARRRAG